MTTQLILPGPSGWTLARGIENDRAEPMGHPHARHCGRLAWTRPADEPGKVWALAIDRRGDYGGSFAIVPAYMFQEVTA